MYLNSELYNLLNKDKKNNKRNLLNNNITKIVSLILSNQPFSSSNLNCPNKINKAANINKKINHSIKKNNLKNYKSLLINVNQQFFIRDFSNINIQKKTNKNIYIKNNNNNIKLKKDNTFDKRQFNTNLKNRILPINNTVYHMQNKNILNKQIIGPKFRKAKSFTKSQKLNNSISSLDTKKTLYRKLSSEGEFEGKISKKKIINNLTVNRKNKNNKYYLIKKRKNFTDNLKAKMNIYLDQPKKYTQRANSNKGNYNSFIIKNNIKNNLFKKPNISYSYERFKKIKILKKNKTSVNYTSNNSDKENTNISIKKNNITTTNYSNNNNNHYYTTNFNSSTNITETNNDLYNSKEKRFSKKKINLPFHPNSKTNIKNDQKKILIRNNKSEINIPYNKNNFKLNNMKKERKINLQNNTKAKDFIELFKNKNFINTSQGIKNEISISKDGLYISSKNKKKNKEIEGIEMNHFRIVAIIQENKKLLRENDQLK